MVSMVNKKLVVGFEQRVGRLSRTTMEKLRILNGLCIVCKSKLIGRKRVYCSDKCYDKYWRTHDWGYLRNIIIRERGCICEKCGFQRDFIEDWYNQSDFVVDHIIPIFLGGKEFDEKNLQVLCLRCNKKKTWKDMNKYHNYLKMNEALSNLSNLYRLPQTSLTQFN